MTRSSFFVVLGLVAIVVIGSLCIAANSGGGGGAGGGGEQSVENTLAVQKTLVQARDYLQHDNAKKAVELLEANLNRVNGDRKFLAQLRDAYRSYVKDLALSNQPALAEVYQARLKILEDNEASYTALATSTSGPAAPAVSQTPVATQAPVVSQPPVATQAPAKIEAPSPAPAAPQPVPAAQSTVRPKADPFDAANELKLAVSGFQEKVSPAKDFLARANLEFVQEHYAAAKQLYEQANQADARALDEDNRKRWAYCQLAIAVDLLNSPPGQSCDWNRLDADVRNALAVAPQLAKTGEEILGGIAKRRGPAATFRPSPFVPVKHTGRGEHGWQVAETDHFRIFHNQTKERAESVAQTAEATRSQMSRKWLGTDNDEWRPKCDIYLYATGAEYSRQKGLPITTTGHSQLEQDPSTGRVVVRQIFLHCDYPTMLDDVLPHETTHVVLAGQFGNHFVPRWADEGIAVLSEPASKIQEHRNNLAVSLRNKTMIPLRDLMQMESYPPPAQIGTFYAQSVALVDYLTKLKGPLVLTQFLRDGLRDGYPSALKRHYEFQSIDELQARFTERIVAEMGAGQPAVVGR